MKAMLEIVEMIRQGIGLCVDFLDANPDLCSLYEPEDAPPPELTEAQIQEIEERAERWYMSML